MASSIGLVGVPSAPISPRGPIYGNGQENYESFFSSIWKMNKELKNKLVHHNNEKHLLESKMEYQLQKSSETINSLQKENNDYGGLVGPYSPKPPVAPMAIGLSGHKLKQQLEQQDQVQFYQKIKHELQVEEHQQMVKKFYQQQKLAFDFPKVIFPSGPVYRNGPHSGQATSQTVCSNNFRRPRLSATICSSPMRPAEIVHKQFGEMNPTAWWKITHQLSIVGMNTHTWAHKGKYPMSMLNKITEHVKRK